MSGTAAAALGRALAVSHRLLAAAEGPDVQELALLDAERLRLLESVRLERDNLDAGDRQLLNEIAKLNDRAIGLMEHHRRGKERALDTAAIGRRAVAAYYTSRP